MCLNIVFFILLLSFPVQYDENGLSMLFSTIAIQQHLLSLKLMLWKSIDAQVAKDPSGKSINALEQHIKNLLCPSTPHFFNTLYDPYREGADFVRGYPFSLREGAKTAVSHGLWLNIPDYDAPTQLVKPRERNTRLAVCSLGKKKEKEIYLSLIIILSIMIFFFVLQGMWIWF